MRRLVLLTERRPIVSLFCLLSHSYNVENSYSDSNIPPMCWIRSEL